MDNPELSSFLGKVDEINDIIKNLNSTDDSERDQAIAKADQILESTKSVVKKEAPDRTGINRTVINKDAYKTEPAPPPAAAATPQYTDQDAFMKALEKDANERAVRKRKQRAEATVYKDEGNAAFKAGDYQKAVELYTKGLDQLKDFKELWTNRAQAFIRLGLYTEALSDCDWAQRVDENYVKGYVLEAKAHLGLLDYDKAIETYNKAKEIDKTKENMINEFIKEVELARESASQERDAKKLFESGAQHPATLIEVMNKVNSLDELPLYYDGGVRVLADLLKDNKCKTLFRTEGGLEIYCKHPFFAEAMMVASLESHNQEKLDACSGMFSLLTGATKDNEESQRQLICQESFPPMIIRFLDSSVLKKKRSVKQSCLTLLLSLTESEIGRKYIATQFNITQLLKALFSLVSFGDAVAIQALNTVNNMALDNRFKRSLHECMDSVLPSFEKLLKSDKHTDVIPSCVTIMTNLCTDERFRRAMSTRQSMITACVEYLDKYPSSSMEQSQSYYKAVYCSLGFLMNITLDKTEAVKTSAVDITRIVLPYLEKQSDIQERVVGCLSHVLPLSAEATQLFLDSNHRPGILQSLLINSLHTKYTIKTLTACTQQSKSVCKQVAANKKVISTLLELLSDESEVVIGNSCLCLSHCVDESSVNETMTKDHLKRLLVLVREAQSSVVKQNCAILIGKLVKNNPRHLESLRELDGIGILHNSTKHYKL